MGTASGNLGCIISGFVSSAAITALANTTLSSITLPVGVWSIVGTYTGTIPSAGYIIVSINFGTGITAINRNACSTAFLNGGPQLASATVSTIICITATTIINFNCTPSVNITTTNNIGQFYAVRIA